MILAKYASMTDVKAFGGQRPSAENSDAARRHGPEQPDLDERAAQL